MTKFTLDAHWSSTGRCVGGGARNCKFSLASSCFKRRMFHNEMRCLESGLKKDDFDSDEREVSGGIVRRVETEAVRHR